MATNGLLLEVRWEWDGTALAADALTSDTVLPVLAASTIAVESQVWVQDSGPYTVASVDRDAGTITLETGLTGAYEESTEVVPDAGGLPGQVWVAEVLLPDADTPIEVPLTVHDLSVMPEGVSDPPVAIVLSDDLSTVIDLPGQLPRVSGSLVDPEGLPDSGGTDGDPPLTSPTPTVLGGVGFLLAKAVPPANADPLTYRWHMSATSGFTPDDATTLVHVGPDSRITIKELPNPSNDPLLDTRLLYGTVYYIKVIATDEDGPGPVSAQGQGAMVQVTGPDIAVETVTAENIVVGTLTGDLFEGAMVLGSTISTGALDTDGHLTGARVDLGPDGVQLWNAAGEVVVDLPTDIRRTADFKGSVTASSLRITGGTSIESAANEMAPSSTLALSQGITAPVSPPTLQSAYVTLQFNTTQAVPAHSPSPGYDLGTFAFDPSQATSLAWDSIWGCWQVIQQKSSGFRIWRFSASTGNIYLNFATGRPWVDDFNGKYNAFITHAGTGGVSFIYQTGSTSNDWWMWGVTTAGATVINHIPSAWIIGGLVPRAIGMRGAIGSGDYFLGQSDNAGAADNFVARRFHLAAGSGADAISDSVTTLALDTGRGDPYTGIDYGTRQGVGGARYTTQIRGRTGVESLTAAGGGDTNPTESFTVNTVPQGFCHNGTQFASVDSSGLLTLYENNLVPGTPDAVWGGYAAYDSDSAGTGQHESNVGELGSFTSNRRDRIKVIVPVVPDKGGNDDPDQWRLYMARSATKPGPSGLFRQTTLGSPLVSTSYTTTTLSTTAGTNPNTGTPPAFPAANPARIYSAATGTIPVLSSSVNRPKLDLAGSGRARNTWLVPIGTVHDWSGGSATPPEGWAFCNGQAVSRTLYPELAALYSLGGGNYRYGNGDGSTTFNLPNLGVVTQPGVAINPFATAVTGWSLVAEEVYRIGRWIYGRSNYTRTGATISSAADGDIANVQIAQITRAEDFPLANNNAAFNYNGPLSQLQIIGSGQIQVTALQAGRTLPSGDGLLFNFGYIAVGDSTIAPALQRIVYLGDT